MTQESRKFSITKKYGHNAGLSAVFRQWRAKDTHCRFMHGYALAVTLTFEGPLDERNWVISFGELKPIKAFLEDLFDHKTVVAADDPEMLTFKNLEKMGLIQLRIIPDVGAEKFAEYIGHFVQEWLEERDQVTHITHKTRLVSVTVAEHEGNSATYTAGRFEHG
jgi:6-pyruvoyltetrahydropterin/6-carboxytetrahydropterin synthase